MSIVTSINFEQANACRKYRVFNILCGCDEMFSSMELLFIKGLISYEHLQQMIWFKYFVVLHHDRQWCKTCFASDYKLTIFSIRDNKRRKVEGRKKEKEKAESKRKRKQKEAGKRVKQHSLPHLTSTPTLNNSTRSNS